MKLRYGTIEQFGAALRDTLPNGRAVLYSSQLWQQQKRCAECSWQGMSHREIFRATCVATKLRSKLPEKLPSVTQALSSFLRLWCCFGRGGETLKFGIKRDDKGLIATVKR